LYAAWLGGKGCGFFGGGREGWKLGKLYGTRAAVHTERTLVADFSGFRTAAGCLPADAHWSHGALAGGVESSVSCVGDGDAYGVVFGERVIDRISDGVFG
jgi:hypothetical protein